MNPTWRGRFCSGLAKQKRKPVRVAADRTSADLVFEFVIGPIVQIGVIDEFSRADIAVASLLAPLALLALPSEHPTYNKIEHPPRMAASVSGWEQRPSIRWVRDIYAQYR